MPTNAAESGAAASSPTELCRLCGRLALSGESVTIPLAEHEALLRAVGSAAARTVLAGAARRPVRTAFYTVTKSRIGRDGELAAFILECRETMILSAIRPACVAKFGEHRSPSRSAICRFVNAAQKAGVACPA